MLQVSCLHFSLSTSIQEAVGIPVSLEGGVEEWWEDIQIDKKR